MNIETVSDGIVDDSSPLNRHYEVGVLTGWEDVLFLLEEVLADMEASGE